MINDLIIEKKEPQKESATQSSYNSPQEDAIIEWPLDPLSKNKQNDTIAPYGVQCYAGYKPINPNENNFVVPNPLAFATIFSSENRDLILQQDEEKRPLITATNEEKFIAQRGRIVRHNFDNMGKQNLPPIYLLNREQFIGNKIVFTHDLLEKSKVVFPCNSGNVVLEKSIFNMKEKSLEKRVRGIVEIDLMAFIERCQFIFLPKEIGFSMALTYSDMCLFFPDFVQGTFAGKYEIYYGPQNTRIALDLPFTLHKTTDFDGNGNEVGENFMFELPKEKLAILPCNSKYKAVDLYRHERRKGDVIAYMGTKIFDPQTKEILPKDSYVLLPHSNNPDRALTFSDLLFLQKVSQNPHKIPKGSYRGEESNTVVLPRSLHKWGNYFVYKKTPLKNPYRSRLYFARALSPNNERLIEEEEKLIMKKSFFFSPHLAKNIATFNTSCERFPWSSVIFDKTKQGRPFAKYFMKDFGCSCSGIFGHIIEHSKNMKDVEKNKMFFKIIFFLLDAVSKIHEKECVHTDIKPDNIILIIKNGNTVIEGARLIDLDNVKPEEEKDTPEFMTPFYLPPDLFAKIAHHKMKRHEKTEKKRRSLQKQQPSFPPGNIMSPILRALSPAFFQEKDFPLPRPPSWRAVEADDEKESASLFTKQSDIFSLGLVIAELLILTNREDDFIRLIGFENIFNLYQKNFHSGRFSQSDIALYLQKYEAIIEKCYELVRKKWGDEVLSVIKKMTNKDPSLRHKNISEVKEHFQTTFNINLVAVNHHNLKNEP